MIRAFYMVLIILAPLLANADPNLQSYKNAGDCSFLEGGGNCIYCPEKRKFISLGSNSEELTPKDSDYEFVDPNAPESETDGTR